MYNVVHMCETGGNPEWRVYISVTLAHCGGISGSSQHSIHRNHLPLWGSCHHMGDGWGHSPQALLLVSTPYNLSKRVCMCTIYTHCGKFMVGLFSAIRLPVETDATAAVDAICLLLSPPQLLDGVFKFVFFAACIFCIFYGVHCSIVSKTSGIVPTQLIDEILTFCILYFSFLILIL